MPAKVLCFDHEVSLTRRIHTRRNKISRSPRQLKEFFSFKYTERRPHRPHRRVCCALSRPLSQVDRSTSPSANAPRCGSCCSIDGRRSPRRSPPLRTDMETGRCHHGHKMSRFHCRYKWFNSLTKSTQATRNGNSTAARFRHNSRARSLQVRGTKKKPCRHLSYLS